MAFENPVVGGEGGELIRESIKSPDYAPGVSGWSINRDGTAEFNNVTIRVDLATGSIIVGPDTGPQVVIESTGFAGIIEFPSNAAFEIEPALIRAQADPSDPINPLTLLIESASVTTNKNAFIRLQSESQDLATPQSLIMGLGAALNTNMILTPDGLEINGAFVTANSEIYVNDNSTNGNYPLRVSRGKDSGGVTNMTTIGGSDTTIVNADTTGVLLETDIAYEVRIQIETRSSSGSSAAGTQRFDWKLWDGSVGGTQLGPTMRTPNVTVGSIFGTQTFSFLFRHSGSDGVRTLNLSSNQSIGTDTLQAQVNEKYFMLVHRVGDPTRINNL